MKIHIAANTKTKKILSINVTDNHVQCNKALLEIVKDIIKSNNITAIVELFSDGTYDSTDIYRCLADNGINLVLKYWRTQGLN